MKNLLIAILLLVAGSAWGQTTQTKNPEEVTLSTTNVTEIVLAKHKTIPYGNVDIWVIPDPDNVGTITINSISNDMSSGAHTLVEDKYIVITVNESFFVKASNSNDKFSFGVMSKD